ncbi:M20/M25/M40 family metallo-hydrolase [Flavobacterium agricola]|uniref:Carboxypeptidase Q n=1 Tax=Flavobacterium agricola TaxID=2870839 RepID=A0ABY6M1I0_9FLAO|nr:M20/M25/M40 family metallo-hydrolase [Flavobacterium agricola]UYW01662.1 M20/M25/M40 family metallo-hydrolase [Flavobacterium agricola]
MNAQQVEADVNAPAYVQQIINKANNESQLESLAFELVDVIGPRLVGSPEMKQAHDWVIDTYKKWGIEAENQPYGKWKSWQRGTQTIEMTYPRIKSLEGQQLAWNANLKKPVEAEVITIPYFKNEAEFKAWLPKVKGKIVLASMYQKYGRPNHQLKDQSLPGDYELIMQEKKQADEKWNASMKATGLNAKEFQQALEKAGASGIVLSYWSGELGANRIFSSRTEKIPTVDISLEDYGLLYRLAENGKKPRIKIAANSKSFGETETFNTVAVIPGTEKADEYVLLSAHLDSWDGSQGACDNGTGTILMMEVARILKEVLPNPKRTIVIGHWGSEEQGLNGSRAYAEDHPEIMEKTLVAFNQDSGTGRITNISGQGFADSYEYLGKWLNQVPTDITKHINTNFPGMPSSSGTDHAAFLAYGVPAFNLGTQSWGYGTYTWHTNRDSYDKIMFNEVTRNVIATAILTYQAAQEEDEVSREKRVMPLDNQGKRLEWPAPKSPNRTGEY